MVTRAGLKPLEAVARLKAEAELRRFAALRRQMAGMDARLDAIEAELAGTASGWQAATTPADLRLVNALTRAAVLDREETAAARAAILPAHEAARQAAARAFGRAEVLAMLDRRMEAEARRAREARASR
ncbi:hypothetical protein GI374_04385 [Paracoccus sp. S-4012]|uniref:hypothetical protein n=1 Tax=Paracoccus sp. S-4012 TaxID=2665648 RepID=UPI0012B0640B|nr:hypothetical protein [Paracoccus sp. S-4012]MRX49697.1 hypothetical protein [Paracoccus sp. S-4012]